MTLRESVLLSIRPAFRLLPQGSPITLVVDGTLFKRSGRKVFGVAWHHDGAAKGPEPIGFGNCWVVAGIGVLLPFLLRPVCLPVLARLWRPRRTGKLAFVQEVLEVIAARHPDRIVHAVEWITETARHRDWRDAFPVFLRACCEKAFDCAPEDVWLAARQARAASAPCQLWRHSCRPSDGLDGNCRRPGAGRRSADTPPAAARTSV